MSTWRQLVSLPSRRTVLLGRRGFSLVPPTACAPPPLGSGGKRREHVPLPLNYLARGAPNHHATDARAHQLLRSAQLRRGKGLLAPGTVEGRAATGQAAGRVLFPRLDRSANWRPGLAEMHAPRGRVTDEYGSLQQTQPWYRSTYEI